MRKISNFEKVLFIVLMILFVLCSRSSAQCDCNITTFDSVKIDSMMRNEQMKIMQYQKDRMYNFDVNSKLECSRKKLKAIEKRRRRIRNLIKI